MAIEQLAKAVVEEAARSEQRKPMFEDSNRNSGMELPETESTDGSEKTETAFYPDSEREYSEGPQWDETKFGEKKGLTDEQKQELKEKTGWSDEIIDAIGNMEEAEIYMDAGLQEAEIDGKKCLIKTDIDMDQIDEDGISNKERMERGHPPLTNDGQEVELHHIGQKPDSPLAELTTQEHRGTGNDTILHNQNKESEIDRAEFAKERKSHCKSRAEEGGV